MKAYDKDSGDNGLVRYSIDGTAPVVIDKDGTVTVSTQIEWVFVVMVSSLMNFVYFFLTFFFDNNLSLFCRDAIGTEFKYTILATDSNSRDVRTTRLKVVAQVKAGTKPPVFNPSTFTARLGDNLDIGTGVVTVTTTDKDPSSTATFKVVSDDFPDSFCIDQTRVLYVQKPLDFDVYKKKQIDLTVEMSYGYQTSKSVVKVTVTDENDNPPVFKEKGTVTVQVSEEENGKDREE